VIIAMLTKQERDFVLALLDREPRDMLALLAGQVLNSGIAGTAKQQTENRPEPQQPERRPGDDPFLITEDEFSYRARHMSWEEQQVLRCRVNAARANHAGRPDDARRYRQRADRLERKLQSG
jgi:hypothetical protein